MKKIAVAGLVVALLGAAGVSRAQQAQLPRPGKEHAWLQQLAGEWDCEVEMYMEPGKPPQKNKGTESVRPLGGFWIVSEQKGSFMAMPFSGLMTLGYDSEKGKFVGSWVDSMNSYLWRYEGTLDSTGKVLTLETEGPCPMAPGELSRFKEVIELKSKSHKVFTSSIQGEDGKWTTGLVVNSRRKK